MTAVIFRSRANSCAADRSMAPSIPQVPRDRLAAMREMLDGGELDYLTGDGRVIDTEYVMSNNFAFGGVNTSLVLRRWV